MQTLTFTAQNQHKGLLGFYLMFDPRDSDNENDPNPNAFRLPSDQYDIPMVFHDRTFGSNKILTFDMFNIDGLVAAITAAK